MIGTFVSQSLLADVLVLGSVGFCAGVLLPFGFRLVGYLVDVVTKILR